MQHFVEHSYIMAYIRWSTQVRYCSCLFSNWQFQVFHCIHFIAYDKVPLNVLIFLMHSYSVSLMIRCYQSENLISFNNNQRPLLISRYLFSNAIFYFESSFLYLCYFLFTKVSYNVPTTGAHLGVEGYIPCPYKDKLI